MARREKGEGSLLKLKGCRYWYAQYYANGKAIRVSTKTEIKQKALAKLRELMQERDDGWNADLKKLTYGKLRAALIANYNEKGNKSLHTYADGTEGIPSVKPLDKFFGFVEGKHEGWPVSQITTDAAREFVKIRQAENMGNAIINRSLSALRRMLNLAVRERKLKYAPVINLLREPRARKGFVEQEKFNQLIGRLPEHLHPLITLLYECGARLGEALQIEWPQVELEARLIELQEDQTKNEDPRYLPLSTGLVAMLEKIKPKEGRVFDSTNLTKEWRKACAACGLGRIIEVPGKPYDPRYVGLNLHDLRRSAIRNLTRAGVADSVAMKISGHKSRNVFYRYNIISTDDVTAAMRALETAKGKPPISVRLVKNRKRQSAK